MTRPSDITFPPDHHHDAQRSAILFAAVDHRRPSAGLREDRDFVFGATGVGADVSSLEFLATLKGVEVLEHELDAAGTRFVHRVLWASGDETAITFRSVAVTDQPLASRESSSN
jgi:hypothetical protein